MIFMPPRHGKSLTATIQFPAWYMGRNPHNEVITASYSSELATDFGSKAREIVKSPAYQTMFPVQFSEDQDTKGKWRTSEGGSYTSVGVGGPITGRGAHLLIIDDPIKNREEAESETYRKKVWDWFTSTAYTRLEPGGAMVVILTRWHEDDLAGRLLFEMEQGGEQWDILNLPAINNEQSLWPERYDLNALQGIKRAIGEYDFEALYQQNPLSPTTREFQKEWIQWYYAEDIQNKNFDYYALVDLAISKAENADNTSIQIIGKEPTDPNIYKIEEYTGKYDPAEVIRLLFFIYQKYTWKLKRVGIESVAYQQALLYFLREEMKKRQEFFNVVELKAQGKKEERIRGLIPLYSNRLVHHPIGDNEFEHELLTFPSGKHDDRIDAFAYFSQIIAGTVPEVGTVRKQYIPNFKNRI